MWCSSVKSSGVMTSSPVKSSTRNAPPLNNLSVVSLIIHHPFPSWIDCICRPPICRQIYTFTELQQFKYACCTHATADTHRHKTVLYIAAFHFMCKRKRQFGASTPQRMAKSNGPAVNVDNGRIKVQRLDNPDRL